jgi:predicted RNA-binding protein with RPS1 domain
MLKKADVTIQVINMSRKEKLFFSLKRLLKSQDRGMKKKNQGRTNKINNKKFHTEIIKVIKTSFKRLASYTEISQGMQKKESRKLDLTEKKTKKHTHS